MADKKTNSTNMDVESVPLGELVLDQRNARKGNVAAIVESIREFGQHRPIVVQRSTKRIIAGNHLYKAAQTLGWTHIDVAWVDDDDETAQRRSLADNASGDLAKWDEVMLAELLQEVGPVPGYDQDAIDKLLAKIDKPDKEIDPIFPIVARPSEKYDYVLVIAMNETDAAYMRTKFDLRMEKSYKKEVIGTSHVVTIERLKSLWGK